MTRRLRPWYAMLALALSAGASAAPDARGQREIDHLLAYVASSGCQFVRGGVDHAPEKARDHLARKYAVARPLIGSADAFIDHVASASSVSGEPYRVRCGAHEAAAKAWLHAELERYRRTPR
ncbi:hypothetical protein BURK1_00183 [Burkholderiales bacterium]|nr:hypothetical protein BURK1_00183 [Burkholderiales bacterium]